MEKKNPSHVIIGSGPAGVACAQALLQQGAPVTLIDAGITLEKNRSDLLAQMSALSPKSWSAEMLKNFKSGMTGKTSGIPTKLAYGSDYPYREANTHVPADYDGVAIGPSLAKGGFSTVWGAAIMPYSKKDVEGWPINIEQLAQHYTAVAKLIGLSAVQDDLAENFPLYAKPAAALALSQQAEILRARLEKNRLILQQAGIHFGQARLAVKAGESGCVYCGLCMYGCPYGYIYSAEQTLKVLQQNPNFTYLTDIIVTRVNEIGESVSITGYHRINQNPFRISADRVYIGAGVVATAGIVLRSLSLYNHVVHLKDSQYFLFPLLLTRGAKDVRNEALYTLSQMFVDIFDEQITPHSVHLQIYSYSDLVGQAVRQPFGPTAKMFEWLARALENRILPVLGFLHSDDSPQIAVALKQGEPDRLQVKAKLNPEVRPAIRRVLHKLMRHGRQLGAWPIMPMLRVGDPGRGFHSGGSFPMRADPCNLETDTLGRLPNWRRIHIVDASVLPDIPATQLTFSVMANAHRIGWHAVNL
jgi:choline dehydrogenase-like flavoprotein